MSVPSIKIIECPRDAMQGLTEFIPTERKAEYLNALLKVGFDTLDFGSFVSPKAIPQLRDTSEVLDQLETEGAATQLLAIVANKRGAEDAGQFEKIRYLGYPFSISPTFLKKNINSTIDEAYERAHEIQELCTRHQKKMVAYVSMAFGNPYRDEWSEELLLNWVHKLSELKIEIISLADTVGLSEPDKIFSAMEKCIAQLPKKEFGLHLHTTLEKVFEKLDAAYVAGCRRFDAVLNGLGGCPMAGEDLVGNLNTHTLLDFLYSKNEKINLDRQALKDAETLSDKYFPD